MDVEVLLAELRERVARLNESYLTGPSDEEKVELAGEVAEKFSDLDEWLRKGGALPKGWAR